MIYTQYLIIIIVILLILTLTLVSITGYFYLYNQNKKNINKLTKVNKYDHIQDILNRIICMVSLDKTILLLDNDILIGANNQYNKYNEYNSGIYFVIVSFDKLIKDIIYFDTLHFYDIKNVQKYIDNIDDNDMYIVLSKGYPFNIYSQLGVLKKLGSKIEKYTNKSNYLLIGSKKYGVFYESISENPIIYPQISIKSSICKVLPTDDGAKPLENNLIYMEQVPNDEKIVRCALESSLWGYNHFGIANNKCIPISDNEYKNINKLNNSDQCVDGIGNNINRFSINIYKFKKEPINYTNHNYKKSYDIYGITMFSGRDNTGFISILNEGEYNTVDMDINVKSMIIPKNYNVYITYKNKSTISIFGPKNINIDDDIDNITIKLIKDNSVIFCDKNNKCFVLDPGTHILDPSLYTTITNVKLGVKNNKVTLYKDISLSHSVQTFNKSDKQSNKQSDKQSNKQSNKMSYKVMYPVIIRSIKIC